MDEANDAGDSHSLPVDWQREIRVFFDERLAAETIEELLNVAFIVVVWLDVLAE